MDQQQPTQPQGQDIPFDDFIEEAQSVIGQTIMNHRMANRIIIKLQAENAELKQRLEEAEIGGLNPDEPPKSELNLGKDPNAEPEKQPST